MRDGQRGESFDTCDFFGEDGLEDLSLLDLVFVPHFRCLV